ncbi:exodeoxyribonuclease VII large subunit [Halioxenophilus aromaticivorans]|uniref:Exodeoxyribonuclease 7 large subunit n=1 Tax=Halioxenophilus aromaticivorans TaxID=1306992 RepID=A0AAV3TXD7_9ALTE
MTQPPSPSQQQRRILSVAQLNSLAKQLLEDHLPLLWVEGEISNFAKPSSGHWYFTLKDQQAQIRCAMFKSRNGGVQFTPKQGDQVVVRGRVSLYEGRGDFQLIAEHMEDAGFGNLQRQFELLKHRLNQEGLFEPSRKSPIPSNPLHVGVVTSPSGAAVRDVLSVLKRRMPSIPVTVIPTAVQGQTAALEIMRALEMAQASGLFDVLVLARGGGSMEDLWCFNDERLARAIAQCPIPVISAVGHEVDFTIADFVADYRAPTPSAAAEILSQSQVAIAKVLTSTNGRLHRAMQTLLKAAQLSIDQKKARLRHPGQRLQMQSQRVDHLELRLKAAVQKHNTKRKDDLAKSSLRLKALHPAKQLQQQTALLQQHQTRLQRAAQQRLLFAQQLQRQLGKRLDSVSPLNTLGRGYAIALSDHGDAITNAQSVEVGSKIEVKVAQGAIEASVTKVKP